MILLVLFNTVKMTDTVKLACSIIINPVKETLCLTIQGMYLHPRDFL